MRNRLIALAWIVLGTIAAAVFVAACVSVVGGILLWIWTSKLVGLRIAATGLISGIAVLVVGQFVREEV